MMNMKTISYNEYITNPETEKRDNMNKLIATMLA